MWISHLELFDGYMWPDTGIKPFRHRIINYQHFPFSLSCFHTLTVAREESSALYNNWPAWECPTVEQCAAGSSPGWMDDPRELPVGASGLSPLPLPLSFLFLCCLPQSGSQQSHLPYRHFHLPSILPLLTRLCDAWANRWSGDCWRQPAWAWSVSDRSRAGDESQRGRERLLFSWLIFSALRFSHAGVFFDECCAQVCTHQMHCVPVESDSNHHCDILTFNWRHGTENMGLSKIITPLKKPASVQPAPKTCWKWTQSNLLRTRKGKIHCALSH